MCILFNVNKHCNQSITENSFLIVVLIIIYLKLALNLSFCSQRSPSFIQNVFFFVFFFSLVLISSDQKRNRLIEHFCLAMRVRTFERMLFVCDETENRLSIWMFHVNANHLFSVHRFQYASQFIVSTLIQYKNLSIETFTEFEFRRHSENIKLDFNDEMQQTNTKKETSHWLH